MLVLTRKIGESITIDDTVKVVVLQIKGKQVRIGIQAPKETKIHREEVYESILRKNQQESQIDANQRQESAFVSNNPTSSNLTNASQSNSPKATAMTQAVEPPTGLTRLKKGSLTEDSHPISPIKKKNT